MKRVISIKVQPNSSEKQELLDTIQTVSAVYNEHTTWSCKNKTYSKKRAHDELYKKLRKQYPGLPSGLIQTTRDNALESIKAICKSTKCKRFEVVPKRKAQSVRYDKRTAVLRGKQLTLSKVGPRFKTIVKVPNYFQDIFKQWKFKGCTLHYNKKFSKFSVHLIFEASDPKLCVGIKPSEVVGVDRGWYNIAATSNSVLYSGKQVRKARRQYLYNRKTLQAKSTRSSKRRFSSMGSKEKRFSKNVNHCVSKAIVNSNAKVFVLEDLSKINKRLGKILNKRSSDWSFYQLEQFLTYKAVALGKLVKFVDPYYTSQECSICGFTDRTSRYKSKFKCQRCGFSEHADINAANNIKNKYFLSTLASRAGCCQSPNNAPSFSKKSSKLLALASSN